MRLESLGAATRGCLPLAAAFAVLFTAPALRAQAQVPADADPPETALPELKPVPVFSAGVAMVTSWQGGQTHLLPLVSPVGLIPISPEAATAGLGGR